MAAQIFWMPQPEGPVITIPKCEVCTAVGGYSSFHLNPCPIPPEAVVLVKDK